MKVRELTKGQRYAGMQEQWLCADDGVGCSPWISAHTLHRDRLLPDWLQFPGGAAGEDGNIVGNEKNDQSIL